MTDMVKIIVTDSAGVEHIFHEQDDIENRIDFAPTMANGDIIPHAILITTRTFGKKKAFESEAIAYFILPRRVDVVFGEYKP